jgi:tetratricopeptide (TPR) repeat protein
VDTQTRHSLKTDSFAEATATSVSWLSGHRSGVVRWVIVAVVAVVAVVASLVVADLRSSAADAALGAAMDTYSSELAVPGAPAEQGVYATSADRARAANQQFVAVADKYGWLAAGSKAHYFAGVTYEELGQNSSAETELKTATKSWNRNLSNLAKLALAGLYHQTDRDSQAIELYTKLAAKPSDTVPASAAQLDLADLYAANGKQEEAKALWAKVKDADKDGAAGEIAAQKLGLQQ